MGSSMLEIQLTGLLNSAMESEADTMSKTSKVTVFLLVLLVASCAGPQPPSPTVEVPDRLNPGANESLAMIFSAQGVQIYECRARKD